MQLVLDTGGKVQHVGGAAVFPVPECQRPQAVNGERRACRVLEQTEEGSAGRIEGADPSWAKGGIAGVEVSNQQRVAELAKICRSQSDTPGTEKRSAGGKPLEEMAVGVEDVNHGCKSGVRHIEAVAEVDNVEWQGSSRKQGVDEATRDADLGKVLVKHIDPASDVIRGVKEQTRRP